MIRETLLPLARAAGLRHAAGAPSLTAYENRAALPGRLTGGRRTAGVLRYSTPELPLVSIITVVWNRTAALPIAIDSIRAQTYSNIEYVVVDGASTDGTLDVVRANDDLIDLWISEPDEGIYDAFNKGVALTTGAYVGFLNSDDYYEPDQIDLAVKALRNPKADWVFGKIFLHGWRGQTLELNGDPLYAHHIRKTMPSIYQVNALARRAVFETFGLFRTEYRIASDYDWFMRITKGGAEGRYDPRIVSHMASGGASTDLQRRAISEGFLICVRNGYPPLRAVAHWSLRWVYVDGVPPQVVARIASIRSVLGIPVAGLRRLKRFGRRIRSALARRLRRLVIRFFRVDPAEASFGLEKTPLTDPRLLLNAFLEARQLGNGLNEKALVSLGEIAARFPQHAVMGDSVACAQAAIMLKTGSFPAAQAADADLIVLALSDIHQVSGLRGKTTIVLDA